MLLVGEALGAISCYKKTLKIKNDNNPETHFNLALACQAIEQYDLAQKHYRIALE